MTLKLATALKKEVVLGKTSSAADGVVTYVKANKSMIT